MLVQAETLRLRCHAGDLARLGGHAWHGVREAVAVSLCLRLTAKSLWSLAALFLFDAAAITALGIISYRKTDGGWRWRWGDR